jgi:hypothetical protein
MEMGVLVWAVTFAVTLLIVVVIVCASWFVREHDKRANYYKKQVEICWRNK